AIGRSSQHSKDGCLAQALIRKAEASRETVIHAYVVIYLYVKGGRILDEFRSPLKIVRRDKTAGSSGIERAGRSGHIRERYLCEDSCGDGADTRGIHDIRHAVEGKLRPSGSIR